MKKIKIDKSVILGSVCIGLCATQIALLGKIDSDNASMRDEISIINENQAMGINEDLINKYLKSYIDRSEKLQEEIEHLEKQKEYLYDDKKFDADHLIVIKNTNVNNENTLYILNGIDYSNGFFVEYRYEFNAIYNDDRRITNLQISAIHFNEYEPLINYLTDEEIAMIGQHKGKVTTSELDKILARIREEYKNQLSKQKTLNKTINQ